MNSNNTYRHLRSTTKLLRNVTRLKKINTNINRSIATVGNRPNYKILSVVARPIRFYNSLEQPTEKEVSSIYFEQACSETLESLCEYFEELVENVPHLKAADIQFGDGVLTVHLGPEFGTYVINRQSPNKQIWLSSPTSGPKRYDLISLTDSRGYWVYKHDSVTLHKLLTEEISKIAKKTLDFSKCAYYKL